MKRSALRTVSPLFVLLSHLLVTTALDADAPITNSDVSKMVKAGISESAILATIQRSPCNFDLSPTAIVKLKEAGAGNAIIESMIACRSSPGPLPSSGSNQPLPASRAGDLPSAYGYYVIDDGRLLTLPQTPVVTTVGISVGPNGWAVDGLAGEPSLTISSGMPTLILYQQNLDISDFHLAPLEFVQTMKAYQFNGLKTDMNFFAGLYHKSPNADVTVNLWRPKAPVVVRIAPEDRKPGMFRMTPEAPLQPGSYALWAGQALHDAGTIFATAPSRTATALSFAIGSAAVSNRPANPGRAVGAFRGAVTSSGGRTSDVDALCNGDSGRLIVSAGGGRCAGAILWSSSRNWLYLPAERRVQRLDGGKWAETNVAGTGLSAAQLVGVVCNVGEGNSRDTSFAPVSVSPHPVDPSDLTVDALVNACK